MGRVHYNTATFETERGDAESRKYDIFQVDTSEHQVDVATSAANDYPVGVLEEVPRAAPTATKPEPITLQIGGVTRIRCSAAISAGDSVTHSANARGASAALGNQCIGVALEAGQGNEVIDVLIAPHVAL